MNLRESVKILTTVIEILFREGVTYFIIDITNNKIINSKIQNYNLRAGGCNFLHSGIKDNK